MNRTLLFISLFSIFTLVSCQSSPKNEAGKQNEVELVAEKQLTFPLDEQTYYLSKSMFQFEENGKEYLHFENRGKVYCRIQLVARWDLSCEEVSVWLSVDSLYQK